MKKLSLVLSAIFALGGLMQLHAQTAEEILAKHIEAVGGKDKLAGVKTVKIDNKMEIMGGESPSSSVLLNGKAYKNEAEFNGQKMVSVVTDKGGWAINPMGGSGSPEAMPEDQAKLVRDQIYYHPLFDYAARGGKVSLAGKEKVGTADAFKIVLTTEAGITNYFIDPTSYLLVQSTRTASMMGQEMEITTSFSDYRKTDYGILVPYTTEMSFGGQFSMITKVQKVEINQPVDESIFQMK
jgi:hypothetical protein